MKNKELIKGIIVPIITPMDDKEEVNETELRNQVNRMIKNGVHGIFTFGTNGEGYILDAKEKKKVLSSVIDETNGRVPVFAGTGCISTKETIQMSLMAKSLGASVLSIITPYFANTSQNELVEHYYEVAKNVDMPIVLYNIPARTGNSLAPKTVEKLSHIDNIVGVKDSSGNFNMMLQYILATRDKDFAVLSGNDSLILWNLLAGGTGAISGCANVYPNNMVQIFEYYKKGELEKAKECQNAIQSFRDCFSYGNPNTIVKKAVSLLGYPVGACRRPFAEVTEEGVEALNLVLEDNKKIGLS